jgi:hypothetical protein
MKRQCRIYVTTESLSEDRTATRERLLTLGDRLKTLMEHTPGMGYSATVLYEPGDFEEEDIERELVEPTTGGQLPVMYLNLTYDLDQFGPGSAEEQAILRDYHFQHVLTDPVFD